MNPGLALDNNQKTCTKNAVLSLEHGFLIKASTHPHRPNQAGGQAAGVMA